MIFKFPTHCPKNHVCYTFYFFLYSVVADTYTKTQDVLDTYPQPKADGSGADQIELHLNSNKKEKGEEERGCGLPSGGKEMGKEGGRRKSLSFPLSSLTPSSTRHVHDSVFDESTSLMPWLTREFIFEGIKS
ncbi:unnamed protein product [Lactuca saligna]|uniref:Uncharacterized protein n=1 Tax=Lactuca saligna TaxID=75948 RepID=A0AA36DXB2_LACSI|nr:unnamed protein product [Lactuca saligna]